MKTHGLLTIAIGLITLLCFGCKKDGPEPKPSTVGFWKAHGDLAIIRLETAGISWLSNNVPS